MIPMDARLSQTDRKPNIYDEIRKKSTQCKFLRITYNFALAKYYQEGTPGEYYEEILEPARLELNTCIDELVELQDTETYGPRIPALFLHGDLELQDPELPPPFEPYQPTEEAPDTGPTTIAPWPPEVPKPTTEPVPPPEEPPSEPYTPPAAAEPSVTPQASAAAACDPLHGTFYDPQTGQCRSSIGTMSVSPFTSFGPSSTIPLTQSDPLSEGVSSFMSGRRLKAAPLRMGRF